MNWEHLMELRVMLADVNWISTTVRICLAALLGGAIGINRGRKKRPAGFRTHMLVCIGSALVMITNQYISVLHGSDPARLGAQVISGIGFLGAGTIIVTQHNQVIGLTTAAGLWASACMGLAVGIGYYSAAILGCIFMVVAIIAMHRFANWVGSKARLMDVYVEFGATRNISDFIRFLKEERMRVSDMEFVRSRDPYNGGLGVLMRVHAPGSRDHAVMLEELGTRPGILFIEEA